MAFSQFKHVKIAGISTVVPEDKINIYDEVQYYDNSVKKVDRMRKMVGFYERHVADKTTTSSDLAYDAALKLFEDLKIDRNSIDALIFVVQKPDVVNPATAYFLHQKLGLSDDCIATDINQGCVGWVYGLYMASNLIESGIHKRVLLLNGDTPSASIDIKNRNEAPIFGDGGVATLLEYSEKEIVSSYQIDTKSYGFEAIITQFEGARFRYDITKEEDFELISELRKERITLLTGNQQNLLNGYMDGIAVFDFTIKIVPETIKNLLDKTNLTPQTVPMLCLHQANKQIVQAVGMGAGFDLEKVPYKAFENYGNNTMCSVPTTLALLDKDLDKKNICCCAFGNGLVSIASILDLSETYISEIRYFSKPDYILSRDEYIDYWRKKIAGEQQSEN